jgi:hypothetical protein
MDVRLPQGLTLALVLWGVIAPLVGILIGHLLLRSWQREQWFRDKRYEDYQAVLSATVAAYMAIVRVDMASLTSLFTPEMLQEVEVIKADSFRVLRDRIFIAEELDYGGILVEWIPWSPTMRCTLATSENLLAASRSSMTNLYAWRSTLHGALDGSNAGG